MGNHHSNKKKHAKACSYNSDINTNHYPQNKPAITRRTKKGDATKNGITAQSTLSDKSSSATPVPTHTRPVSKPRPYSRIPDERKRGKLTYTGTEDEYSAGTKSRVSIPRLVVPQTSHSKSQSKSNSNSNSARSMSRQFRVGRFRLDAVYEDSRAHTAITPIAIITEEPEYGGDVTPDVSVVTVDTEEYMEEDLFDAGEYVHVPESLSFVPQRNARTNIIKAKFEYVEELGHGMSGSVYRVRDKRTMRDYALKSIKYKRKGSSSWGKVLFLSEYKFLTKLSHEGIVELVDVYMDDECYHIVTEYGHTDLFKRIKANKRIPEEQCKIIIRRMLETIVFLHDHDVVHRDIKPENVVFTFDDPMQPKLIDFGDALRVEDDQIYKEFVGTRCYLAPERWRRYTGAQAKASDVWSVGVATFEMVTGKRCFYAASEDDLIRKIRAADWRFPKHLTPSRTCAHFIQTLLTPLASGRITARYALQHPWLRESSRDQGRALNVVGLGLPRWCTYFPHLEEDYKVSPIWWLKHRS